MVMTLPVAVDFRRFHDHDVASWLSEGRGRPGAAHLGARRSLTIRLTDGASCTYRSDGNDIAVELDAADEGVVVELDQAAFSDFVNEMWSVFGLLYSSR